MKKKWPIVYLLLLFLPYITVLSLGKCGYFEKAPAPQEQGETVTLYRHESGRLETLPLTDYLWGVLAGEMPASYPAEALKAQVVASYSYLKHRMETVAAHPATDFGHEGDVCDDPDHCKAYLSPAEAALKWGEDWLESAEPALRAAVEAVEGRVLTYEGKAANTVFHAVSGGRTEAAADVWGAEVPYLRSVDSHWDVEAAGFGSTVTVPLTEFCEKVGSATRDSVSPGAVTLTEGGSVAKMVLGDRTFTGRELRSLFGLRSTRFTLTLTDEEAVFSVRGYGHQVGMSQYGASVLASEGYGYDEILEYYYPGTTLA